MRVAIIHAYYASSSPSGENRVFEDEAGMLESRGHEVKRITYHNDDLVKKGLKGKIQAGLYSIWNPVAKKEIVEVIKKFNPDIVHVHNTFPSISSAFFYSIAESHPVVYTLHNYRLFCAAAIPLRDGKPCLECINKKSSLPSVVYGCYRNNRLNTIPVSIGIELNRKMETWNKKVDAFICLTSFQKEVMTSAGLPSNKTYVKPNFCERSSSCVEFSDKKPYVLYVGRLSSEKGILTLIEAWRLWGEEAPELRIIGSGDLESLVEEKAQGLNIKLCGKKDKKAVHEEMSYATLVIVPSESYETFGLVAIEAFSYGTVVIASDMPPLSYLIEDGLSGYLFHSGNPQSIVGVTKKALRDVVKLREIGVNAKRVYDEKYTESINYTHLMGIYENVIEGRYEQ